MATFITSKAIGETIGIYIQTSTGFWKYNHDGGDSTHQQGYVGGIEVANANGEFTLISCDSQGNISGNITILELTSNQLTSFNGNGLTSLTFLGLGENTLTSFDGSELTSLTDLALNNNQLTSLDGFIFPTNLKFFGLENNTLTSFDLSSLTNLIQVGLNYNQLTSLDEFIFPTNLISLSLGNNMLTSFDASVLTSLSYLFLDNNQLTSLDGFIFPSNLNGLGLFSNNLMSIDLTGLSSLSFLGLDNNPITPSVNNQILQQLNQNGVQYGYFTSSNGRTSASNADFDNLLNNLGWSLTGLYLVGGPPTGSGKLRVKGFTTAAPTTTTTTTEAPTTTTTTTEASYYAYDFSVTSPSSLEDFAKQFNKYGAGDWDGSFRIITTGSLGIGKPVYYVGTDGDKHLMTFENYIVNDASNYIAINGGVISEMLGTVPMNVSVFS